jgi:uncharacterized protein (DUF433 family)
MTQAPPVDIASFIEIHPTYMGGGWPVIAGRRLPVIRLAYESIDEGHTPEQIARNWELSLEQVHAALAYYYANREALDRQVQEAAEEGERIAASWPSKVTRTR